MDQRGRRRKEGKGSVEREGEKNGVGSGVGRKWEGREDVRGDEAVGVGGGEMGEAGEVAEVGGGGGVGGEREEEEVVWGERGGFMSGTDGG